MTDTAPTYRPARAARAYIVHLLPCIGQQLTSTAARCGWRPTPRGHARPTWYGAPTHNPANRCPICYSGVPTIIHQEQTP